jgi:glycosyltransferase involved in cell wall biosynthesis
MSCRITVITPFLNAGSYLAEAIASVRAQTIGGWEMVIVDDGSTDQSAADAIEAARADPRIRLMRREPDRGLGAAAARNLALAEARGDYVCFLDADDVFLPHKIERQAAILDRHADAAMVYGPTEWWYPTDPARNWIEPMGRPRTYLPPVLLDHTVLMLRGHVPCICAVLIRRRSLNQVGGFDVRFRLYEDQTLWVKIMASCTIFIDDEVTARYRQHAGSVSAASQLDGNYNRTGSHPARQAFLDWCENYVLHSGLAKPSTLRALRCARATLTGNRSELMFGDRIALFNCALERQPRTIKRRIGRLIRLI